MMVEQSSMISKRVAQKGKDQALQGQLVELDDNQGRLGDWKMLEKANTPLSVSTEKKREDGRRVIETVDRDEQREQIPVHAELGMTGK